MMNIMCDESRRLKQNTGRIEQLMTQTLADRRKLIVTDGVSLKELKTSFPCLFNHEQVLISLYNSKLRCAEAQFCCCAYVLI